MAEGDLTTALQGLVQRTIRASSLTDLEIGTVTGVSPLEVTVQDVRDPIPAVALRLTAAVVEKKIPVLTHSHTTAGLAHLHQVSSLSHSHRISEMALGGVYPTEVSGQDAEGTPHIHQISGLGHDHGNSETALDGSYPTEISLEQDAYDSDERLGHIVCFEHGKELPVRDGYIILNRGLEMGDKVLMLKVLGGQNHIILSRIFEEGN